MPLTLLKHDIAKRRAASTHIAQRRMLQGRSDGDVTDSTRQRLLSARGASMLMRRCWALPDMYDAQTPREAAQCFACEHYGMVSLCFVRACMPLTCSKRRIKQIPRGACGTAEATLTCLRRCGAYISVESAQRHHRYATRPRRASRGALRVDS